ncbi:MAG: tyrosine-type recombinase/integrase [Candidatus Sungiibacteriota bacterium]|uniref:Tyrosine-type recombinase/integrase n=1 Tax=Candidatus Sungiibacteriota bacterium TaxID=2750080 RepID=A0A7T5UQL0_9BACT|nr:MAG: tyrosine-type recombinase/integrase [Candidatus Sungbacteria bacterium]
MSLPYLDDFLLSIKTNNYSPETLYNYERDLKVFERFLKDDTQTPFQKTSKRTVELYKAYLSSRDRRTARGEKNAIKLSAGSINRALSSLRRYLKYLVEVDLKVPLAPEAVKLVKTPKKHPRVAEFEALVQLIESPTKFEKITEIAFRNRAMLETLFATGMRISELISLNRDQIDKTGRIFIRGKGKKERFVYLTDRAKKHIWGYLSVRNDSHPALFIPYRGRNAGKSATRISSNYLQMKIKQYRGRLEINVPTSAHSLRHGFATYLAEQGANPAAIQILLGHESLQTTTRYVHASDKYAENTHKRFHPLK